MMTPSEFEQRTQETLHRMSKKAQLLIEMQLLKEKPEPMSDELKGMIVAAIALVVISISVAGCTMFVEQKRQESLQLCMQQVERVIDCFFMGGTWDATLKPNNE